ncbi:MAG: UDP-N-acetylmuramoyl-tripeptide--D-alanyl-D-alanine ligase [Bacillota bacterium]
MEELSIKKIREAVGGKIVQGNPEAKVKNVCIDSRILKEEDLFIAIIGERFDGHSFIEEAVNKGAKAVIVDRSIKPYPNLSIIRVKDTTEALQDLAHFNRMRYKDLKVVGVTGSVGKTTTKDMLAWVLKQKYKVLKSEGNYNNHYGLPLSLLSLEGDEDIAVLEMAMSNIGEIKKLAEIAKPEIGVVTNVGQAHLENLDNVANVAEAKKELIEGLPEKGLAVLNYDNDYVRKMDSAFTGKKIIYYGLQDSADIYASNIKHNYENKNIEFELFFKDEKKDIVINKPGEHNIYNALAAISIAREFDVDWDLIKESFKNLDFSSLRLDIREKDDFTVINDSYNANPLSMKAAIDVLKDISKKRSIAVLGDMLELGPKKEEAHYEVGKYLAKKNIDILITVGDLGEIIANAAEDYMENENIYRVENNKNAYEILNELKEKEDCILVKGSRKMKMEEIVDWILK